MPAEVVHLCELLTLQYDPLISSNSVPVDDCDFLHPLLLLLIGNDHPLDFPQQVLLKLLVKEQDTVLVVEDHGDEPPTSDLCLSFLLFVVVLEIPSEVFASWQDVVAVDQEQRFSQVQLQQFMMVQHGLRFFLPVFLPEFVIHLHPLHLLLLHEGQPRSGLFEVEVELEEGFDDLEVAEVEEQALGFEGGDGGLESFDGGIVFRVFVAEEADDGFSLAVDDAFGGEEVQHLGGIVLSDLLGVLLLLLGLLVVGGGFVGT